MARRSTRENKNIYQRTREKLGLTRESAAALLETMAPERIEKIESERSMPHPDEVLLMSDKYRQPTLCNYYCANTAPISAPSAGSMCRRSRSRTCPRSCWKPLLR